MVRWPRVSFLILAVSILAAIEVLAAGHLMIYPARVVLEGRVRTAQIDLINNGTEPAMYRLFLVRERMTDRGEFKIVDTPQPGEHFADEMIRFSPRQVTLPAGASQAVRLQLRKPADLPTGEYRSHLVFQALPSAETVPAASAPQTGSQGVTIEMTAIVSITIPVIVRQGETTATLSFANLRVNPGSAAGDPPVLAFELRREGNRSVYGDIVAYFTPRGGKEIVVGRANGVAVYVPNPVRIAELPLQLPTNQKLANGRLRVLFLERPEAGGRVLTDAKLDIS